MSELLKLLYLLLIGGLLTLIVFFVYYSIDNVDHNGFWR